MAEKKGRPTSKRKSPLRYFFINGKLHKKLRIDRANDVIMAWSYPDGKRVGYTYSDVLRRHEKAFTTKQVCTMLERGRTSVEMAVANGNIERPQITYDFETKKEFQYLWSEKDIMNLHDFFLTVHRGRPRKDGEIVPQAMPSKRELRALIRHNQIMYVKSDDGEFVPTWRAEQF